MSKSSSTRVASDPEPHGGNRAVAAILAGGRARRFDGAVKPLLQFSNGDTILDHLICELRKCPVDHIVLSTNAPSNFARFDLTAIPDNRPGAGPAGGMEAVLERLATVADTVLFVPGDAPAFNTQVGSMLLNELQEMPASVPAVFAEADGNFHPTMAAVRTNAIETIKEFLDCGVRKLLDLWTDLGAHVLQFDDPTPFENVNSEEEWQHWLDTRDTANA